MKNCLKKNFVLLSGSLAALGFFVLFQSVLTSSSFRQQAFTENNMSLLKGASPALSKIEWVEKGLQYLQNTSQRLPDYVGAKINCTNCHLNQGKTPGAAPWTGITFRFPKYRHRTGKDVDLKGRINDCFERSLNGKALPDDHPAMKAMLAYMGSLSPDDHVEGQGIARLKLNRVPNLIHGEKVYNNKCAQCHQTNGAGMVSPQGQILFPPLWGKGSFNIGAGMARLHTAAGFVKHNMPLKQGDSLSDDEAWDVAAYFTQKDRPDFAGKINDWPKGNKPEDARY